MNLERYTEIKDELKDIELILEELNTQLYNIRRNNISDLPKSKGISTEDKIVNIINKKRNHLTFSKKSAILCPKEAMTKKFTGVFGGQRGSGRCKLLRRSGAYRFRVAFPNVAVRKDGCAR